MNAKTRQRNRAKAGFSRKFDSEKIVSQTLLGDFEVKNAEITKIIEHITNVKYDDIRKNDLIFLAKKINKTYINKHIPRNYLRGKQLVMKWLDQYSDLIRANSSRITCVFSD